MADLTAGGAPVYRDSAGVLREAREAAADPASAMLPVADFTDAQRAMAQLPLPFRNLVRDPFIPDIGPAPTTTAYPPAFIDAVKAKSCSSFRIINPNLCYIRFRGATGPDDLIQEGEGRLIGPHGVEVFSTQNPTHLSIMPVTRPGCPVPAELVPPELNYGIGS